MTPEQKIQHAILIEHQEHNPEDVYPEEITAENIEDAYESILVDKDFHWDAESEFRCSGTLSGLPAPSSRHYEAEEMATQLPDGSWVGWTHWYGGGKHGNPEEIDWMSAAYLLNCFEEEVMITRQTFSKEEKKQ